MQDIKLFKSKCTFRNSFILIIVLKNFVGKVRADVHMVHTDQMGLTVLMWLIASLKILIFALQRRWKDIITIGGDLNFDVALAIWG